jgi:hypothetical protein
LALVTAVGTAAPLSAQEVALENSDIALVGVGQRAAMPISLLHAGSDVAEVERVMGRPTATVALDPFGANRSLVYAHETERTEVTLTVGHVTAIALDPLPINSGSLPSRARMVKPMMRRSGVLALLGKPYEDQTGAASGIDTERMVFKDGPNCVQRLPCWRAGCRRDSPITGKHPAFELSRCRRPFRTHPLELTCASA